MSKLPTQTWNKAKISPHILLKKALSKRENRCNRWLVESRDAHRLNLDGYIKLLHSQPYRSAAGGVAIYTIHTLNAFKRTALSTTDDEFETIWVEIVNTKAKNILCCCAYTHPSFSPVRLKENLESTLSQLTSENKSIFIIGDFDINLLNCERHPESNDFLLMLNSFFLLP